MEGVSGSQNLGQTLGEAVDVLFSQASGRRPVRVTASLGLTPEEEAILAVDLRGS